MEARLETFVCTTSQGLVRVALGTLDKAADIDGYDTSPETVEFRWRQRRGDDGC